MSPLHEVPAGSVPPRGLPDHLPQGEQLLWQGSPVAWQLARHAFHLPKIAVYFAILLAWRIGGALADGATVIVALHGAIPLTVLTILGLGVVGAIAWLSARTTVYSITTKRIVLRCGIALPLSVNIPFRMIASAGLKPAGDGSGDIAVKLPAGQRIAYLSLWPHVRPWRVTSPEPALRCVPDAANVANILAQGLVAASGGKGVAVSGVGTMPIDTGHAAPGVGAAA